MTHKNTIKPIKIPKKFYFKDMTDQQVVDILDQDYPINLKHNRDLVNRVCVRYPAITKTEVSIIIKEIFKGMRQLLVLGKVLNFNNFLMDVHLIFFNHPLRGIKFPKVQVKLTTPTSLKD